MDKKTRKLLDIASRSSLFAYAISAVAIPVSLLAITRELGLNLTQAGSLSLISSIIQFGILLGAIPLASAFGKIRTLRYSIWIMALGLVLFTRIDSYITALITVLVIGFGQAILEALLTPLVEDIHPEDDGTQQVFLHSFWPMGVIFGTLAIGDALSRGVSWRILFLGVAVLAALVGFIFPRRSKAALPRSPADFSHAGEILSKPLFWLMGLALAFAGGAEGGFTFWTASYIQIEYGTLARAGGLGTALFAAGMAIGRILASRIASKLGLKRILVLSVSLALLGGIGFYFVQDLVVLYGLMVLMGFFIAPFWPSIQTYSVRRLGGDPTMIMVFLSCFGIVGFSSANFLMGVIGDAVGLRSSFLVAPALLAILLLVLLIEDRFNGQDDAKSPA